MIVRPVTLGWMLPMMATVLAPGCPDAPTTPVSGAVAEVFSDGHWILSGGRKPTAGACPVAYPLSD
jgi:hypothetical protein